MLVCLNFPIKRVCVFTLNLFSKVSNVNCQDNLRQTSSTIHRSLTKYTNKFNNDNKPIYTSISQAYYSNLILIIYARPDVISKVKSVDTQTVGLGIGNLMSNKGAISTRVTMNDGQLYNFVNAHLTPHDENLERRNEGIVLIIRI